MGSIKPVAVIILGADALLAARPATPIQLWHACLAAGYDLAVPATWGDELIAAEALRAAASHPETVTVMCSCPMVARMVGDGDTDLSAHLISLVAPPVATARYLRRVYGERRVHITFAGACPSAADSAIDAWLTPAELLERFSVNAIDLARQPQLFESVLPPDRRRHLSQPGGLPAPERGAMLPRPRQVVEIDDPDILASLRRHLMGGVRALVDIAPRAGCACSGVLRGVAAGEARLAVTLLEPPRSARPVLPDPAGLGLLRRVPPRVSAPRPTLGDDARAADSAPPAAPSPSDPGEERARAIAASRPTPRSPLSWNLRERALPQPSTGGRAPVVIDSVTAAAIRALEAAAKGHTSLSKAGGVPTPEPAASSASPAPSASVAATESGGNRSSSDDADTRMARAVPPPSVDDAGSRPTRATPPGGYWFVSPAPADAADAEVRAAPSVEPRPDSPSEPRPESPAETRVEPFSEPEAVDRRAEPTDVAATSPESTPGVAPDVESTPADDDVDIAPGAAASAPAAPSPGPDARNAQDDGVTPLSATTNGDSPDRGWVIAMTIILLVAGTMVIRDAVRRVTEPATAIVPVKVDARGESVAIVGKGSVAPGDRRAVSLDSLFVGPSGNDDPVTSRPRDAGR